MTDDELRAALKSASMKWFVRCYGAHERRANEDLSHAEWMAALEAAGCPEGKRWSRRTPAVRIFKERREEDALRRILDSDRVGPSVKQEARRLLGEM